MSNVLVCIIVIATGWGSTETSKACANKTATLKQWVRAFRCRTGDQIDGSDEYDESDDV